MQLIKTSLGDLFPAEERNIVNGMTATGTTYMFNIYVYYTYAHVHFFFFFEMTIVPNCFAYLLRTIMVIKFKNIDTILVLLYVTC